MCAPVVHSSRQKWICRNCELGSEAQDGSHSGEDRCNCVSRDQAEVELVHDSIIGEFSKEAGLDCCVQQRVIVMTVMSVWSLIKVLVMDKKSDIAYLSSILHALYRREVVLNIFGEGRRGGEQGRRQVIQQS